MAATANRRPIFEHEGQASWITLTTANIALDGTGAVGTLFTADAINGGRVEKVIVRPLGSNIATVLRLFVNNGAANSAPANNSLIEEKTIPANTLSQVAESVKQEIPLNLVLPPGYKILATIGTSIVAGVAVSAVGGKY